LSSVINTNTASTINNLKLILKPQQQPALLLFLPIILGSISIQYFSTTAIQYGYAMTDQPQIRTLSIKVHLEKDIVHQGETQTIRYHVVDEKTLVPIGGAITTATIRYAGGANIKQASELTDESGDSAISFRIGRNAPLGTYTTFYSVFEAGYVRESGSGSSFSVTASPIVLNQTNSNNTDTSDNYSLPITGYTREYSSGISSSMTGPLNEFNQIDADKYINSSDNYALPRTDSTVDEHSTDLGRNSN
jgi:hypothetical protein